jgi:predicted O-methyltransferase YrrM
MTEWSDIVGCDLDEYCDRVYELRPEWVTGSVSSPDARFLFERALRARTEHVVEIGTASGFSTTFICLALDLARRAKTIGTDFGIVSYDISPQYYADTSRTPGDAARELLDPELLGHITFRAPASSLEVRGHHPRDSVRFMFLDANHAHPWPTLDLLATLDCLAPGAEVVVHDINLPLKNDEFPVWGAKYLFDDLRADKEVDPAEPLPNIGSLTVPAEKDELRDQLLSILFAHPWERDVDTDVTTAALA